MSKRIKEPVSSFTHFTGAVLSVPCMVLLIVFAALRATPWHVVSFAVFGASLILLYTASGVYHLLPASQKVQNILQRIDHMMIFVLIAGTYTPICLIPLRGPWGFATLGLIWAVTFMGIIFKAAWPLAPRWVSTGAYLALSWFGIFTLYPLAKTAPAIVIIMLAAGGLVYTAGAVIYALKRPRLKFKFFGFHELFHLFVLGGSSCHIVMMFFLISA